MDILSQSGDDSSVVLRCLIRQLAPFSPQTAPRQAQLFHQYVQILQRNQFKLQNAPIMPINTEFGIITSGGLANLEWAKPFVDLATVATFPGLALSKLAYGITSDENGQNPQSQTQLQTFARPSEAGQEQSEQLDLLVPDDPSHAVFPSKTCHLFVWEEMQQIAMDVLNKESPQGKNYSHFGLFSNQFTNNGNSSPLPSDEPFSVRLGFQNPFPFPLVLRNLCLSLDQLKLRHGCSPPFSDKFRCSIISELAIPPLITNERTSAEIVLKKQFVDLHVLPGPELEHFAVNGIKFDLCSPSANDENGQSVEIASISAFFPLSVRGKRLFKSKEQRMTKQFAVDKRLSAAICSFPVPLLSFRPIGGDPGFIKAVTHWHPLEAFCDQIVQIVFEIENIGRIDVEQLRFCANFAEQVSISEPSGSGESIGRWTQCSAKVMSTAFTDDSSMAGEFGMDAAIVGQFGKVSKDSPLRVGGKIGLRVAIRVQQKPQNFYFLFLYIDQNGSSRQFRFAARVRPLSRIFDADYCVLNETIGLSMLKLRCLPLNSRESDAKAKRTLTKLDLLRLSVKSSDGKVREKVRRVDNEPIQLENATEQNLCFYISNEAAEGQGMAPATEPMPNFGGWTDVWLGKTYVPDFPEWQKAERRIDRKPALIGDEQQTETLQMKLLWKASVIRGDGTVSNVFGEFVKQIEQR